MRQKWKRTGIKPSCGPRDTDSYSVSHYHSDLNSIFAVCFSPEGSIHRGGDKQITHWCGFCHMQISSAKLFLSLLAFLSKPAFGHWIDKGRRLFTFPYVYSFYSTGNLKRSGRFLFIFFFASRFVSTGLSLQGAAQIAPHRHCQLPQ